MSEAPSAFGPYRLVAPLRRGSMGVVYRGEHEESGAAVAVKTIDVDAGPRLHALRREILMLSRVSHAGLARILDHGVAAGRPWFAMELVEGPTLREVPVAAGSPEGVESAVGVARRLCAALGGLHGAGVVHRDLKPENVVVGAWGPVIVDFGLGALGPTELNRDELEVAWSIAGTVSYMAPEQARGDLVDARADLYALGCILYERLTGRPPFTGRTSREVLAKHQETEPERPSRMADGVPAELDEVVLRLLAKRPRDRYGFAGDVAAALARVAGESAEVAGGLSPTPYLYRSGLWGREAALALVESKLAALSAGRGGALLVTGESGGGKTRLAMEAAARARRHGVTVVASDLRADSLALPLQGFRGLLLHVADRCREGGAAETEALLGPRAAVLADYEPALPHDAASVPPYVPPPDVARARLADYLARTLAALALRGPLLLIVDDLQWADELTLSCLRSLVEKGALEERPVLLVLTCRSDEMPPGVAELEASGRVAAISIGRLDGDALAGMVGDMLGLEEPPTGLARYLLRHSEGNPFFAGEYLRTAVSEGLLRRDAQGRWSSSGPDDDLPLPGSIRELLGRRLHGLGEVEGALLEAAAVLGEPADVALLHAVAGGSEDEVLDGLGTLLSRELLDEAGSSAYRLAHDKIRILAYERMEPASRRARHAAAAAALRERPEAITRLPHHLVGAGERELAREACLAAARHFLGRHAHAQAEAMLRSYLELEPPLCAERVEARRMLGSDLLLLAGRRAEAADELRQACEDARALGDAGAEAHALWGWAQVLRLVGRDEEARARCGEARALYGKLGDASGEGRSLTLLALMEEDRGNAGQARLLLERALEQARDDRGLTARALGLLGNNVLRAGDVAAARAAFERAVELHAELGDRRFESMRRASLAGIELLLGQARHAARLYEQSLVELREMGDRESEGICLVNLATACQDLGEVERAEVLVEAAVAIHMHAHAVREHAYSLSVLVRNHWLMGNTEAAGRLAMEVLGIARRIGERRLEGDVELAIARVRRIEGRTDDALRALEAASSLVAPSEERMWAVLVLLERCWVVLARDETSALALLVDEARAAARAASWPLAEAEALVAAGEGARREGRLEEAKQALVAASAILSGIEEATRQGLFHCEAGHVALSVGASAEEHLQRARQAAGDLARHPRGHVGGWLARLARAIDASRQGRGLVHGVALEDLPGAAVS